MRTWHRLSTVAATTGLATTMLVGCGSDDDSPSNSSASAAAVTTELTLYSGRSEELVGPLVERLSTDEVGITAAYDKKANQIAEEGDRSPADLFFAQDAGELGALDEVGLLEPLPDDIAALVPDAYQSADENWAAVSARARVLVYAPDQVDVASLPEGIDGLLDPSFKGKIGYAPTNASFKSFVTALRVLRGDDGAKTWLEGFLANEPVTFEKNGQILDAVNAGTISAGLINHYYWAAAVAEKGIDAVPSKLHFFSNGDPGALINVAGVAVLKSSDDKEAAFDVVRALLNADSQRYFAEETSEYPIAADIALDIPELPTLAELSPPDIDLDDLADLAGTEDLLTEVGAL